MKISRKIPVDPKVLIGRNDSDSVLAVLDGNLEPYRDHLSRFALIGPLLTDVPGVKRMLSTLAMTGIRSIVAVGTESPFKPIHYLQSEAGDRYRISRLGNAAPIADVENRDYEFQASWDGFERIATARLIDEVSLVPFRFKDEWLVEVYEKDSRRQLAALRGNGDELFTHLVRTYDLSSSHVQWCYDVLCSEGDATKLTFKTLGDAFDGLLHLVGQDGFAEVERTGEALLEMPVACTIRRVGEHFSHCSLPRERLEHYAKQATGEIDASGWQYDIWTRIEGQYKTVVDMLRESPQTKRAQLVIGGSKDILRSLQGISMPCHQVVYLRVRRDRLDLTAVMRANDLINAFVPDVYAFMALQAKVAGDIGVEIGEYRHFVNSMFINMSRDGLTYRKLLRGMSDVDCHKGRTGGDGPA